jgi:glycosyltransferase involved in cell wall biosynthesis
VNRQDAASRIVIVGANFGFPNGAGAAARVRCYARGLRSAGAEPYVVIVGALAPSDIDDGNTQVAGDWHGVSYEYASGAVRGAASFLGRRLQELRALQRLSRVILTCGDDRPTAVIFYGYVPRWLFTTSLLCSLRGVRLLQDISEYPYAYVPPAGPLRAAWRALSLRLALKLPDGVIVITRFLEQSLAPLIRHKAWLLRVPIMVDAERFDPRTEPTPGLIAYAGHLGHAAELDDLIVATALIAHRDPTVRLEILGGATGRQREELLADIEERGLAGRVDLVGPVSADEMPARLARAAVLVLARADGLFSRAGMPTKLGEYLASGRPVVVTATGDIPDYLHDGVDSYLVPPGDVKRLSEAIARALHDPLAPAVGSAGRQLALRAFDPAVQMAQVLEKLSHTERP